MSRSPPFNVPQDVESFFLNTYSKEHWESLCESLSSPPSKTFFRVIVPSDYEPDLNFSRAAHKRRADILPDIQNAINKHCFERGWDIDHFQLQCHPILEDVLYLPVIEALSIEKPEKEIMIDTSTATAVLRGANIFAPGILAVETNVNVDDKVAIMVDLEKKCLRGYSEKFQGLKFHVGNGILKKPRRAIFSKPPSELSGDGVFMVEPLYRTCGIPLGFSHLVFLQNITSTLTTRLLNVEPNNIVLDMCASPGGKTVHIASMLRGTGFVIALDKNKYKIDRIKKNAQFCGVESQVRTYAQNATKLEGDLKPQDYKGLPGQGFAANIFDRIMLDPPCTGFGQRPTFSTTKDVQEVRSFRESQPAYQIRLMAQAVRLLKPGGTMVYSTCTLNPYENEAVVAWCLNNYTDMELLTPDTMLGGPGLAGFGLEADACSKVQRFDPVNNPETVGFFIAKLRKIA
ncbi:S-adenosyl-L-methionine-dependent methyltransferase [Umbelopsis sp. AD052]|nr:S-adenosyl-L-methionine-dependent methyltransferase [Umbelopsis sp. AD052]